MDVTFAIVSFNVADFLDKCLYSIKKETSCKYEIIVVDNASQDKSVKIVQIHHPEVILKPLSENVGFAKANNIAFQSASGRYIFMLNPDTLILDGAVDKLVRFMDTHPEAGVCGPKNLNSDLTLQHNCHHFPSLTQVLTEYLQLRRFFPKNRYFGREHMSYWNYDETKEVDWITGCSLFIRSEIFKKIGLLDEKYFMYSEECDFCYRMKINNLKTFFYPCAAIIHYGGQSSLVQNQHKVFSKTITKHFFKSRYRFFRKNYGEIREFYLRILDMIYYSLSLLKNILIVTKKNRQERISSALAILRQTISK